MRPRAVFVGSTCLTIGATLIGVGVTVEGAARPALIAPGVVLALVGLWVLMVARRPHPAMRRHTVVRLSPAELQANARAGESFPLDFGKARFEVAVRPEPVTVESAPIVFAKKGDEPRRLEVPLDTVTFAGEVLGVKESEVRLTITDEWVRGYVMTPDEWWFVEPMRKFRLDADLEEHVAYRTQDLRFKLEFGDDYKPMKVEQSGRGGGTDPPHRVNPTVPVAMVHDEQYSGQALGRPYDEQRALINEVNGIFRQLDCQFFISVFIWSVNWLTSTNADRMLDQVEDVTRSVWTDLRRLTNRQTFNTEVAHATTGKNLDGNTLGIAWRPGVYSLSQQTLLTLSGGGGLFGGGGSGLAFQNMMVAGHELGHNFNGAHDEADEWCVAHFIWCWDYVRTIMWPTFYDDNRARFSDGTRNSSHNNAQRISDNMATGRNRDF